MELKTRTTIFWGLVASFALFSSAECLNKGYSYTTKTTREKLKDKNGNDLLDKHGAPIWDYITTITCNNGDQVKILTSEYEPKRIMMELFSHIMKENDNLGEIIKEVIDFFNKQSAGELARNTLLFTFAMTTILYGSRVFWNYIEDDLRKPTVVTESYRKSWFSRLTSLWRKEVEKQGMVFTPALDSKLNELTQEIQETKTGIENGANLVYPNIVLHGPPGTGKTMWAKRFARQSGKDFYFIPAAALFQDGAGLQALNKIFKAARKSKNGVVLFIDEADALFLDRSAMNATDTRLGVINAFLAEMGEGSNKFMVIATTNHLQRLDKAMERRFPEVIEMELPGFVERVTTLTMYRDSVLCNKSNSAAFIKQAQTLFCDKKIKELAQSTEHFSYDDLGRIINSMQTKSLRKADRLTDALLQKIVEQFKAKKAVFKKNIQTQ